MTTKPVQLFVVSVYCIYRPVQCTDYRMVRATYDDNSDDSHKKHVVHDAACTCTYSTTFSHYELYTFVR